MLPAINSAYELGDKKSLFEEAIAEFGRSSPICQTNHHGKCASNTCHHLQYLLKEHEQEIMSGT